MYTYIYIFIYIYICIYIYIYIYIYINIHSIYNKIVDCPISFGCRICRLHHPNKCPRYDTKQFDGEVPVMLELLGMWSTLSLPSLPGPLWPRVVAPDKTLFMSQIELNCVLILNWSTWNRTVLIFRLCAYAKLNCLK